MRVLGFRSDTVELSVLRGYCAVAESIWCPTLEALSTTASRNIGHQLPTDTAQYSRRATQPYSSSEDNLTTDSKTAYIHKSFIVTIRQIYTISRTLSHSSMCDAKRKTVLAYAKRSATSKKIDN
jgi:hypothetical protein